MLAALTYRIRYGNYRITKPSSILNTTVTPSSYPSTTTNPFSSLPTLLYRRHFSTTRTAMKVFLQVVGTNAEGDISPSTLLFFDKARYLFNCGPSTQRLCTEHKVKLGKFDGVFLAGTRWDRIGGLPGFILTAADSGLRKLSLYGAPDLTHALASTRHFIGRPGIELSVNELVPSSPPYKDEFLTVHAIHSLPTKEYQADQTSETSVLELRDPRLGDKTDLLSQIYSAESAKPSKNLNRDQLREQLAKPHQKFRRPKLEPITHPLYRQSLPPAFPRRVAISYIGHAHDVLGKFDPKAAIALKLTPGPDYAKLKNGETVLNRDGVEIRPEQCVGPSRKGAIFMVVDCPSVEYIPSLTNNPKFLSYQQSETTQGEHTVAIIIHTVGPGVLSDPAYLTWMKTFGSQVNHLLSSPDVNPSSLNFLRSAHSLLSLSMLDSGIFSLPFHTDQGKLPLDQLPVSQLGQVSLAVPRQICQLDPQVRYEYPESKYTLPIDHPDSYAQRALEKMAEFRTAAAKVAPIESTENVGPFISTLGTGSALPSLTRNVSSNLVTLKGGEMIVLDAGEGTLGQLFRHLGQAPHKHPKLGASIEDFYNQLRLIYISHPHADHHLGLVDLLIAIHQQQELDPAPRFLVVPRSIYQFLWEYNQVEDLGLYKWRFIDCRELTSESIADPKAADTYEALKEALHLRSLQTCHVNHCQHAYGVRLDHKDGFSLVYSGDTRPCDSLVTLGQGVDVLIHEATMSDDLIAEARAKKHSTISEAFEQADAMEAKQLLLTHFSQRFPRYSRPSSARQGQGVAVGFDLMCLDVGRNDLDHFTSFLPALNSYYTSPELEDATDSLLLSTATSSTIPR